LLQDQSGLKDRELSSILAKVHSKRESVAKGLPDYWRRREEIAGAVEQKLGGQRRGSEPAAESQARSRPSVQGESSEKEETDSRRRLVGPRVTSVRLACFPCAVLQIRPRSSSLPSRASRLVSAVKQPKTPQPIPRTRTSAKPKTSTPKTAPRTFTTR